MRRVVTALLAMFLAVAVGGCKSPPPHTDSTKGTNQDRDTGMHDNHM